MKSKSVQIGLAVAIVVLLFGSLMATRLLAQPNPGDQLPFPVVQAS